MTWTIWRYCHADCIQGAAFALELTPRSRFQFCDHFWSIFQNTEENRQIIRLSAFCSHILISKYDLKMFDWCWWRILPTRCVGDTNKYSATRHQHRSRLLDYNKSPWIFFKIGTLRSFSSQNLSIWFHFHPISMISDHWSVTESLPEYS